MGQSKASLCMQVAIGMSLSAACGPSNASVSAGSQIKEAIDTLWMAQWKMCSSFERVNQRHRCAGRRQSTFYGWLMKNCATLLDGSIKGIIVHAGDSVHVTVSGRWCQHCRRKSGHSCTFQMKSSIDLCSIQVAVCMLLSVAFGANNAHASAEAQTKQAKKTCP